LEELRKIFVIEQQAVPEKKKSFLFWSWTEAAVPGEKPNEPLVVLTLTQTLEALVKWHEKQPKADVSSLLPLIGELEKNDNPALPAGAAKAKKALTPWPRRRTRPGYPNSLRSGLPSAS